MRKQRLRNRLLTGAFVMAALAFAGCGGGSDSEKLSPAEENEAKIADLQAEYAEIEAQYDEASAEWEAANDKAQELRDRALDLIASGDVAGGTELTDEADVINQEAGPAHAEMNSLMAEMEGLSRQIARETTKREANLGCDKACRKERNRISNLAFKCMDKLSMAGVPVNKVVRVCDKRFPMPKLEGE